MNAASFYAWLFYSAYVSSQLFTIPYCIEFYVLRYYPLIYLFILRTLLYLVLYCSIYYFILSKACYSVCLLYNTSVLFYYTLFYCILFYLLYYAILYFTLLYILCLIDFISCATGFYFVDGCMSVTAARACKSLEGGAEYLSRSGFRCHISHAQASTTTIVLQ